MGIYIKGIEMPTDNTVLLRIYPKCNDGVFYVEQLDIDDDILDKYWAVPVPEHGDLIDSNKLYEKTAEWEAQALHMFEAAMRDGDTTEWRKWSIVLAERSAFKFDVADAPTIIPAEEGET